MGPEELTLTAGSLEAQERRPGRWSRQFPKRQRWLPAPSEPVWLSLGTAAQGWGRSVPESWVMASTLGAVFKDRGGEGTGLFPDV